MTFGDRLRYIRKSRGLRLKDVADRLFVRPSTVSQWEKGKHVPDAATIGKLADIFGVSIDYFFDRTSGIWTAREESALYVAPEKHATVRLPVLGVIRAGQPIYADANVIDWEDVPASQVRDGEYFFLVVVGDSMIGDRIYPGDRVLVRRQDYIEDGQIAVVMVGQEEATIKRVQYLDGRIALVPSNPKYRPLICDPQDVKIIGRVKEVRFRL